MSDLMASYASPSWLTVSPQLGMPSLSAWPATATTASGSHTGAALLTGGSAVAGTMGTGRNVSGLARRAGGMFPGFPQGCEDDFECNDGKANFPLQCCEMPLLGKFCCEPPDDFATGVPNEMPAYVPLPVPVDPLDQ